MCNSVFHGMANLLTDIEADMPDSIQNFTSHHHQYRHHVGEGEE